MYYLLLKGYNKYQEVTGLKTMLVILKTTRVRKFQKNRIWI